jgi:hypothetical protein
VTLLAALAFGFILGRLWEMRKKLRRDQVQRTHETGFNIPIARLEP